MLATRRSILLFGLAFVLGFLVLRGSLDESAGQFHVADEFKETMIQTMEIEEVDRQCQMDYDCVVIQTECDYCSCGTPVNERMARRLRMQVRDFCEGSTGGVCDFHCPTPYPVCRANRCELSDTDPDESTTDESTSDAPDPANLFRP